MADAGRRTKEGLTMGFVRARGINWLSLAAGYAVQVAPGEDDVLILASVLALDLAMDAEHH
jgi:uncharacterized protein YxjI